jgi:hypothetical protein
MNQLSTTTNPTKTQTHQHKDPNPPVVSLGKDPNPAQTHHPRPISPNPPVQRPKPTESTNPTQTHHPRPISAAQTQQPPQATTESTNFVGREIGTQITRKREAQPPNQPVLPSTTTTLASPSHHRINQFRPSTESRKSKERRESRKQMRRRERNFWKK